MIAVFCQNGKLRHGDAGRDLPVALIARLMVDQQREDAHNVEVVSLSLGVALVIATVLAAARNGLRLLPVYNAGGDDSSVALHLLDGIVDIDMPDAKFTGPTVAQSLCGGAR